MATCDELRDELNALDTKIKALLDAVPTTGNFDWSVGHVRIDNGSRITSLKELQKYREDLWSHIQKRCPVETVETVTHGLNEFGDEAVEDCI